MQRSATQYNLSEISTRFGLELRGDGKHRVDGVGTLAAANSNQISFLSNPAYRKDLATTRAGAVVLNEDEADQCPGHCLVAKDPYLAYARIASLFDPRPAAAPGVHPSAVVAESARLGRDVSIAALAVVGEDCVLGDGCTVGAGTVLEPGCVLGDGCRLHANVSLGYGVRLGKRVIVHPGAVLGADGFGVAFSGDRWEKVPQLGSVSIGDDCEIGANTCIDRGAIDDTVLEEDVRIDNLCQVAHNVWIGAHTAIAGHCGISGSTRIGRYCLLAGQVGIGGHIEIADRTTIAAGSKLLRSITEPGQTWSAHLSPQPFRTWQRTQARLGRLDELARKVGRIAIQLRKSTDDEQ